MDEACLVVFKDNSGIAFWRSLPDFQFHVLAAVFAGRYRAIGIHFLGNLLILTQAAVDKCIALEGDCLVGFGVYIGLDTLHIHTDHVSVYDEEVSVRLGVKHRELVRSRESDFSCALYGFT